jgi:hypothetical protein
MGFFQNFNNFAYGFAMAAQPLTVTVAGETDRNSTDDLGRPTKQPDTVIKVTEPLVNSANPNLTFQNADGGQNTVGTMYWVTKRTDIPYQSTVKADNSGVVYKVIDSAQDVLAGLIYYSLKAVNAHART